MKRLDLIKNYVCRTFNDVIAWIRVEMNETKNPAVRMAYKHILNALEEKKKSLWFSKFVKDMDIGKIGMIDIDKVVVSNGRIRCLMEFKSRMEDFHRVIMLNLFQFETLLRLSKLSGIPAYYVIEVKEYDDVWFRILNLENLKYNVRRLGDGHSRDFYACIDLRDSILLDELEFKDWLKEILY